jgi:parallel beta-helix repeat protein
MSAFFIAILVLAFSSAGYAATLTANASNVQSQITAARCGDTILVRGDLPIRISIKSHPACPVTLDLTAATVQILFFQGASNWKVIGHGHGAGVVGLGSPYNAIQVVGSDHLVFSGLTLTGYGSHGGAGITMTDSNNIEIEDNIFRDAPGDGIDVISSQHIAVTRNTCERLPYGVVLHTDCVQIWNKPKDPFTVVDVVVDHNRASGHMQGFDTFGAGDPRPLVGVSITNNDAEIDIQWAGAINTPNSPCVQCKIRGNNSKTLPSYPRNWAPVGWYDGRFLAPGNRTEP